MHTEQEIRDGLADCKEDIRITNEKLTEALEAGNDDKIAECAAALGVLGISYLTAAEILK